MHVISTLMALCGLIAVAFGITCYDCESLSDPRCNQYFEPEGVNQVDCDMADMPQYLHKYERRIPASGCITKVHEGIDGRRFFIRRGCYYGDIEETQEACDAPDPYVPFVELISCNVCVEDLCNTNTASKTMITALSTLIALLVSGCSLVFFN